MLLDHHCPGFVGFDQFSPNRSTFEKEALRILTLKHVRIGKQLRKRCTGACGDQVERFWRRILDPGVADFGGNPDSVRHFLEEAAFLGDRFIEDGTEIRTFGQHDRQDQAGKAGTATQIDQASGVFVNKRQQLRGIPYMAPPDLLQGIGGNEVHPDIPIGEKSDEQFQPRQCFT